MHCREARNRIEQITSIEAQGPADSELRAHLAQCSDCAERYEARCLLLRSLAVASDDNDEPIPFEFMRRRVEQASRSGVRPPAPGRLQLLWDRLAGHPARAAVTVVALALIVIAFVVPIHYQRTVGYELSLDGVRPDLVDQNEKMCDLLYALGLGEAAVDVGECDSTCTVTIFDLKTVQEAQLVASSLELLHRNSLQYDVIPVRSSVTGSLFEQANERLLNRLI